MDLPAGTDDTPALPTPATRAMSIIRIESIVAAGGVDGGSVVETFETVGVVAGLGIGGRRGFDCGRVGVLIGMSCVQA